MTAIISFFKNLFHPDTLNRTAKTFAQAALAAFVLPAANAFSLASWKAAVVAAAAAGGSAVWNSVLKTFKLTVNVAGPSVAPSAAPRVLTPVPGTQPGPTPQPATPAV